MNLSDLHGFPEKLYPLYRFKLTGLTLFGYEVQWSQGHVARVIKDDVIESAQIYHIDEDEDLVLSFNIGSLGGDGQPVAREATDADIFAMAFSSAELSDSDREDCLLAQRQYNEAISTATDSEAHKASYFPANLFLEHRSQMERDIASGFETAWSTDHLCRFYKDGELKAAEVFCMDDDGDLMRAFSVGHAGGDGQDIPANATDEELFKMARNSAREHCGTCARAVKRARKQYRLAIGSATSRQTRKQLEARIDELEAQLAGLSAKGE